MGTKGKKPVNITLYEDQIRFLQEMLLWGEVSAFFRCIIDKMYEFSNGDPRMARKIFGSILEGELSIGVLTKEVKPNAKTDGDT